MYVLAMYDWGSADVFAICWEFVVQQLRVQQQKFWRSRILPALVKFLSVITCPGALVADVNVCSDGIFGK
jgi:hypothetical protein